MEAGDLNVKLKLDENLSRHLRPLLEALGHDVLTVADEGLLSQPDAVIAAAARAEGRILLTLDVEFADLRKYPPGDHPGIILFRPRSFGPLATNEMIRQFIRSVDLKSLAGCVVVVEPGRMRIRRPER
jgi:predicted nuclease of predicted toxin-antitoxin system